MKNSNNVSLNSSSSREPETRWPRDKKIDTLLSRVKWVAMAWKARWARIEPKMFATFAFADESGRRMRMAQVHRELQAFLTGAPRGLVELPRDHGKTVQVLIRVLWEIGRDPNLRVLIACGSGALAAQRGRFLRDAIAENWRV